MEQNEEKENNQDSISDDLLPELSRMEEEPELDIEVPNENGRKGLSEQESESPDQSDKKAIIKRLLPSFTDTDIDE